MLTEICTVKAIPFLGLMAVPIFLCVANVFSDEPLVDIKGKKIAQIGFIVKNSANAAIEMGRLFGVGPWMLLDVMPTEITLHDKYLGTVPSTQRIALGNLGDLQIELIQPLYGGGTHTEFLEEHGQGIHHMSFGPVDDYDAMFESMKKAGFGIDMRGILAGAANFTYMATQDDLGTIIEFVQPIPPVPNKPPGGIAPLGNYTTQGPTVCNMKGKSVVRLGIVVRDVERSAKRYWEVFGIGPWTFTDMRVTEIVLHGRSLGDIPCTVRSAVSNIGDLRIELLQALAGPSTFIEFFGKRGNGIHYVSFGEVEDADEMQAALQKEGYGIEMQGTMGEATQFTLMDTRNKLGGFFGFSKRLPGKTSTLAPYGTYPASE